MANGGRRRPDSALQINLPAVARRWASLQLPAEAGCRRERQRHAHNVSISKAGKNLFWDPKGEEKLSKLGWSFIDKILTHGNDIACC